MPSLTVDQLRNAVSAGDYLGAERLLADFREEMQARWNSAATPEERSAVAVEVGELLEWARAATLAGRAHAQRKLIHLTCRKAYSQNSR